MGNSRGNSHTPPPIQTKKPIKFQSQSTKKPKSSNTDLTKTHKPPQLHHRGAPQRQREVRERDEEAIWREEKEELWDKREI